MQRVTTGSTRYRTFYLSWTWIGHNETFYHNFNLLPHALPCVCSQYSIVSGYSQRITARYRKIYKYIYIYINIKKNDGNELQIAQNQKNLRENIW